jgi:hypothetical protein
MENKGGIHMDKIYKTKENTESTECNATDFKGSYIAYPGLQNGEENLDEVKPLITDIAELVGWVTVCIIFSVMLFQII